MVEEFANASICYNVPYTKSVSPIIFYTKQTLYNKFWKRKDHKRSVAWEILRRHQAYNTSSKRCLLCLDEMKQYCK